MYAQAKAESLEPYSSAFDGDIDASACVVCYGAVPDAVRSAVDAALKALGHTAVYVDCSGIFATDEGARGLFSCLEGIDANVLVVADELAAGLIGQTYRCDVPLDAHSRLFGRDAVAFTSFEADLSDPKLKQRDWALLKKLKR